MNNIKDFDQYLKEKYFKLSEKDKEYLPERLEEWQMSVFLCMIKNLFWHILLKQTGLEMPSYIRIGAVSSIYNRKKQGAK